MARPFTASDDQILQAARKVIGLRGADAFSIAEVASEVGLSRAAIILRFKSTHALKVASLTDLVREFADALEALPQDPSGDNLLRVAAFIGSYVRSRESSAKFFERYSANVKYRELIELEIRRSEALRKAVSNVMPPLSIDHQSAITAFCAHLTGSILTWIGLDDSNPRGYLVSRTSEWLRLARIPFDEAIARELLTPPAEATHITALSKPRRSKTRARSRLKSSANR